VGSIYIEKNKNMADYRIRDSKIIESIIFPIFDKYPLLTSKYFNYLKFKRAHSIITNSNLTKEEKNTLLLSLLNEKISCEYISPA
jgi:hypothetical protein